MRIFIITFALMLLAFQAQAGTDGINQLNSVMQNQSSDANGGATGGATRPSGLGAQGQQPTGNTSPKALKPPKATLQNPNLAKLKQLDAQMKAMKQKMDSINGLPTDQQQRIDQMEDLMAKMMALMANLMSKASGAE